MDPRRLLILALIAPAAALACTGEDAAPDRRTLVDSRDTEDPRSLDPALSTDVPTGRAVSYLFDGLTRFTPDARVEPGLAERWDVSPDGRVYTFHLRQGVVFHDGTPFVARHVVRSWERALDPATRGGRGWPLYPISGAREFAGGTAASVAGLATPDDSTVVATLAEPLAIFPKMLAMPVTAIVPDSTPASFGQNPVGTGPWRFVEWRHDDYIKYARNERYWAGAPRTDSLLSRIIPETGTAVAEFQTGNVDILEVPASEAREWEQTDARSARLLSAGGLRLWYVAINTQRGPLRDARVRRAINMAIDRETILQQLAGGRGTLAAGVVPRALEGHDSTRTPYPYDTAAARRLLADAGYPNGIAVELWSSTAQPFPRVAEAIQGYLGQVGIRAKLVQRDAPSVREASRNGEVDMHVKDWFADYPDAENFLYPLLHSANTGVGGNVSFYSNPAYDALVSRARTELRDAERVALYRQADSLQFADAPMVYLFFYNTLFAVQPWIEGFEVPVIFNGQRLAEVGFEARE